MFKTCQTNFQTEVLYEQTIRCNLSLPRLAEVTSTLVKMAVFCSVYIDWDDVDSVTRRDVDAATATLPTSNIVMPYTEEEERWVNAQFKFVDEAFRLVK